MLNREIEELHSSYRYSNKYSANTFIVSIQLLCTQIAHLELD